MVVIEKERLCACWGDVIWPLLVIRQLAKFMVIKFEYHKGLGAVNYRDISESTNSFFFKNGCLTCNFDCFEFIAIFEPYPTFYHP